MQRVHSTWGGAFSTKAWTQNFKRQQSTRAGQLIHLAGAKPPMNDEPKVPRSTFEQRLLLRTKMMQIPGGELTDK
jgi:hypothetical protein